jgi:hypothetical protein
MMGRWLARLKNGKAPAPRPTKPTEPPQGGEMAGSVGFVVSPLGTFPKNEGEGRPAEMPAEPHRQAVADAPGSPNPAPAVALDPDRWCWPNSPAMNTREIDTFTARLARFTDKGVSLGDAERLADSLVIRDREGDHRRLCLECSHLQGAGRWRCGNWRAADVAAQGLARDLALTLQRCGGFAAATGLAGSQETP